jgi:hypothetical protein
MASPGNFEEGADAFNLLKLFVMIYLAFWGCGVGLSVDNDAGILVIYYPPPAKFSSPLLVKPNEQRSLNCFSWYHPTSMIPEAGSSDFQ